MEYFELKDKVICDYFTNLITSVNDELNKAILSVYKKPKPFRYIFYYDDRKYKFCLMIDSDTVNLTTLIRYYCNQVIRQKFLNKGIVEFSLDMNIVNSSIITLDWYGEEFWLQFPNLRKVSYISI